jgi:hypothetical protein
MIYRELLHIRQEKAALQEGTLELFEPPKIPGHLLGYKRKFRNEFVLVLINFGEREGIFSSITGRERELFQIGNYRHSEKGDIILSPKSGLILTM